LTRFAWIGEAPATDRTDDGSRIDREVFVKRFLGIAAVLALLGFARGAHAQSFGPWTGAEIMPAGGHAGGVYIDTADDAIGALGQLRMSFYPNVDFGFQGGLSRFDQAAGDRTLVRVGGDLRAGVMRVSGAALLDVSLGGGLGISVGDDYSLLSIGPTVYASRSFPVGNGSVTPYANLGFSFESIGTTSDNGLGIPVTMGTEYRPSPTLGIVGQFIFGFGDTFQDDVQFGLGVNLPF
jgi:hypothetical protein